MAVAYWVEMMGQDEEKKMDELRERMLDAELQTFMGNMVVSEDALAMGATFEEAMLAAQTSGGNGGTWN